MLLYFLSSIFTDFFFLPEYFHKLEGNQLSLQQPLSYLAENKKKSKHLGDERELPKHGEMRPFVLPWTSLIFPHHILVEALPMRPTVPEQRRIYLVPQMRHILVCEEISYLNFSHWNEVEIFEVYFQNNFSLHDRILSMIRYHIYTLHTHACVYICICIYVYIYIPRYMKYRAIRS